MARCTRGSSTSDGAIPVTELLSCPFCGGEGQPSLTQAGGLEWAQVECVEPDCGAVGPTPATKWQAIAAWNCRTPTTEAGVSLEEVEVLLGDTFDFLGGVDDAAELRDRLLGLLTRIKESKNEAPRD